MVEYWKEQDAFYKPVEFGLYNPREVSEKFVAPKGFNPIAPVVQEKEAPKREYGSRYGDWIKSDTRGIPNWVIVLTGFVGIGIALQMSKPWFEKHIRVIPDDEYGEGFPIRLNYEYRGD